MPRVIYFSISGRLVATHLLHEARNDSPHKAVRTERDDCLISAGLFAVYPHILAVKILLKALIT
jgi:hypothetical protein